MYDKMPFQYVFLVDTLLSFLCDNKKIAMCRHDVTACCSLSGGYEDVWLSGLWFMLFWSQLEARAGDWGTIVPVTLYRTCYSQ